MTSVHDRLTSMLSDRYRIERELGRGGMATVYLAEDVRHHRKVAVKVLHPELSAVIGSERFLKEIELTAGLQHPHILPLFDSGTADGLLYYVMPWVEGETLRGRLDRERQLPVADAVRIATEVASALEYAHNRHVVHRDIKPENILLQSGSALVADFGIALAVQSAGGERMTQTGLSLGTPHYMAPEQAMGERSVDHRADIYALGAVTWEMLSGEPPFTGPTVQSIIAKVLTEEPGKLTAHRRSVPQAVEDAVLRALEKLPADRWTSAQAFATALASNETRPAVARGGRLPDRRAHHAVAWTIAVIACALAAWGWMRRPASVSEQPPSRLSIVVPGGTSFPGGSRLLDLSADGTRLVYYSYYSNSTSSSSIDMLHELDGVEGTPIKGTQGGIDLHLSHDARTLYFGGVGQAMMSRVTLDGGVVTPMEGVSASSFMSIAPDGSLWISTLTGSMQQVTPDGKVTPRFTGDTLPMPFVMQQILGNGHDALVKELQNNDGLLHIMDLRTGKYKPVLDFPIAEARYAAGYLVYVRNDGRLNAMPYDIDEHKALGPSIQIADDVTLSGNGIAQFAVAQNGTIAYVPAQPRELMLVNRSGGTRALTDAKRNFHQPRFSPDGSSILVDFPSVDGRDVWKLDRSSGALLRVTSEHDGHDANWAADGRSIVFASVKKGVYGIYQTRPGSGTIQLLQQSNKLNWAGRWMPDGKTILTVANDLLPKSGNDVILVDSAGHMTPLVSTPATEQWVDVSPDGRWLAYTSDLSGQTEVFVRAVSGGDQVQVSLSGGTEPMWSRNGRELFYRAAANAHTMMTSVTFNVGTVLAVASRTELFQVDDYDPSQPHSNYDVSPDGQNFVMVRRGPVSRIVVIQNLPGLVKKLQGTAVTR